MLQQIATQTPYNHHTSMQRVMAKSYSVLRAKEFEIQGALLSSSTSFTCFLWPCFALINDLFGTVFLYNTSYKPLM